MKLIRRKDKNYENALKALYNRPACPPEIEKSVLEIVESVRLKGDSAVRFFLKKFDGVDLTPERFRVSEEEIRSASGDISDFINSPFSLMKISVFLTDSK